MYGQCTWRETESVNICLIKFNDKISLCETSRPRVEFVGLSETDLRLLHEQELLVRERSDVEQPGEGKLIETKTRKEFTRLEAFGDYVLFRWGFNFTSS